MLQVLTQYRAGGARHTHTYARALTHNTTIQYKEDLAWVLNRERTYFSRSEELLREVLSIRQRELGNDDAATTQVKEKLGQLLLERGDRVGFEAVALEVNDRGRRMERDDGTGLHACGHALRGGGVCQATAVGQCAPCARYDGAIAGNASQTPDFIPVQMTRVVGQIPGEFTSKFVGNAGGNVESLQKKYGCQIVVQPLDPDDKEGPWNVHGRGQGYLNSMRKNCTYL